MNILLIILVAVFLYSLLAIALKIPSFSASRAFKENDQKTGILSDVLDKFTVKLTPKIKLLVAKKSNLEKLLTVAGDSRTPEELVAKAYVNVLASLCLAPFAFLAEPLFAAFPVLLAGYSYRREFNLVKEEGEKRQRNIENEMLKFVMYMANALKTENNVMTCIEQYKMNFDTPLTEELTLTLAEMRVGNYEQAITNMEKRNNSEAMKQLVSGLQSAMKGDDTKVYFSTIGIRLTAQWEENLKRQAMAKKPKITQLSLIMFAVAAVTIGIVLVTALSSSTLLFGGTI